MIKWIKRIIVGVLGLLMVLFLISWISFYNWKKDTLEAMPYESSVVQTPNGPVEYIQQGEGSKYMLIVHGSPGSAYVADTKSYVENGFNVIAISRPGYYNTPLTSGKTPKAQAELYKLLLDQLGVEKVYVNAISGGGPSGIQFTINYPERTSGLILRAAISGQFDALTREPGSVEKFIQTEYGLWLLTRVMSLQADEVMQKNMEKALKKGFFPLEQTKSGLQNDAEQFSLIESFDLEKIKVPTLIIHGNKDVNVPFNVARNTSERIPNSKLFEMDGKDHFVFFSSYKDTINSKIIEFVKINSQF